MKYWTLISLGLVAASAAVHAAGCRTNGCNVDPDCGDSSQGSGGGGNVTPSSCIPHDSTTGPVKDECGIFVRKDGDDMNEGTAKMRPLATIAHAIELAQQLGKPIYVCAEIFTEPVVIPSGVEIYGGLNCAAGWSYVGATKKTTIATDPDKIPLKFVVGDGEKAHLEDIVARAADATITGGSSIAAIADMVTVELVRSELMAGAGKFGDDAAPVDESVLPTNPDDPAIQGNNGAVACKGGGSGNPGGAAKKNDVCGTSIGGAGGKGVESGGEKGGNGEPVLDPNPNMFGLGGAGGTASGCQAGTNGVAGDDGDVGVGAKSAELGLIDVDGYVGTDGTAGKSGLPGQGGGGGGGSKGKMDCHGASGGSGGAGGCGGQGGKGGKAGGSSIALISLGAKLVFTEVKLTAGNGGAGGAGGIGQQGGVGGNGGKGGLAENSGTLNACSGGSGGPGGYGGRGGGGRGGHSIAIAWTGEIAPEVPVESLVVGSYGSGGDGEMPGGVGANGEAAPLLQFK